MWHYHHPNYVFFILVLVFNHAHQTFAFFLSLFASLLAAGLS
ncbi:hypothetical protein PDIG_87320 [Penicillium digitatum PHI26]|uniref:Uncharacterized protein n=2 Tax=Penicillium digitatum TaxID=36651 RepID=K9F5U1_PEND2|nr:hypothetical protein PDIP_33340 [Penicillium digitatum Pd1]EKV04740.1 hypothetical protein PDIG_87320 [Penicillium digitatum PHI26]EKV17054.1 hypothetical protein PDIP_33340 [Penicillium digitatum Pd1]